VNAEADHHGYSGVTVRSRLQQCGEGRGGVERRGKGRRMSKEREEVQIKRMDGAWMIARGKGKRRAMEFFDKRTDGRAAGEKRRGGARTA